jgi:uncharacterized protein (DUF58 family)
MRVETLAVICAMAVALLLVCASYVGAEHQFMIISLAGLALLLCAAIFTFGAISFHAFAKAKAERMAEKFGPLFDRVKSEIEQQVRAERSR